MKLKVNNLYLGRMKEMKFKKYPFAFGMRFRIERTPIYLFEKIETNQEPIYQDISSGLIMKAGQEYYSPFDLEPFKEIYPHDTIGKTHAKLYIKAKQVKEWCTKR